MEGEFPAGSLRVDVLDARYELDALAFQACDDLNEVVERTTEPVELLDNQSVPPVKRLETASQLRAVHVFMLRPLFCSTKIRLLRATHRCPPRRAKPPGGGFF
jgi:hypothetical protein